MKLSVLATSLAICSAVIATPVNPAHDILFRPVDSSGVNTTAPAAGGVNTTAPAAGGVNTTAPAAGGYSNTTAAAGPSNTSSAGGKIWVFVTGGTVGLTNSSDITIIDLYNASQALNITQLYALAGQVNSTLGQESTQGVVIVSNQESLEPLGIFTSLLFNTAKPLVITQNGAIGAAIAQQSSSSARGPVVVGDNRLIYAGALAPAGDESSCTAVGISSDLSNATWFYENSVPVLIGPNSTIKQNYSNFTNYNISTAPVVPIIYDGVYSSQLISSLPSASAFVVVSAGSNSTLSTVTNSSSPIVFAEAGSGLRYVGEEDVPYGTIPAGYLSPVKAQILLSVAAANGVTDQQALRSLFP
ncbi:hypothetical protein ZYGR_0AV02150 [Zygosaccharomyces rouxii]|uniref:Asparaginase n=1 Tax=Zygosaccharomyces rouxii TaxID=4956 RepID=A0A1Q3AJ89_ZYGRO|nr:hypothetical protein ZYGR_0AV02150 [Zygosaccharomyces rouxii]